MNHSVQPTLWDKIAYAIGAVESNANEYWKQCAATCIEVLVSKRREFTADDILEMLDSDYPDAKTHNTAALGPVIKQAQQSGLIRNSGRMQQSRLRQRHRKITIWESVK